MSDRDLSYSAWQARRRRDAARAARLDAGLPPFRRLRLRSASEAAFLRRIGTPESLIGPVASDEDVERQRRDLVDFARRLRASAPKLGDAVAIAESALTEEFGSLDPNRLRQVAREDERRANARRLP
jgi:hypothetical protein